MLQKHQNSVKNDRIIRSTDCLVEFCSIEQLITVSYVVVFHNLTVLRYVHNSEDKRKWYNFDEISKNYLNLSQKFFYHIKKNDLRNWKRYIEMMSDQLLEHPFSQDLVYKLAVTLTQRRYLQRFRVSVSKLFWE